MLPAETRRLLTVIVVFEQCRLFKVFLNQNAKNSKRMVLLCAGGISLFAIAKLIQKHFQSVFFQTTYKRSKINFYFRQFQKTQSHKICSSAQTSMYLNIMVPFLLSYVSHQIKEVTCNLPSPINVQSFVSNVFQSQNMRIYFTSTHFKQVAKVLKPVVFGSLTLYWFIEYICDKHSLQSFLWNMHSYCLPSYFARKCKLSIMHYNRFGYTMEIENQLRKYIGHNEDIVQIILRYIQPDPNASATQNITCFDPAMYRQFQQCSKFLQSCDSYSDHRAMSVELFCHQSMHSHMHMNVNDTEKENKEDMVAEQSNGKQPRRRSKITSLNLVFIIAQGLALIVLKNYCLCKIFPNNINNNLGHAGNGHNNGRTLKYCGISLIWFINYILLSKPIYETAYETILSETQEQEQEIEKAK